MGKLAKQYNRKEFHSILTILDKEYDIVPLTVYQWRLNNQIDIYPSSCKYFDLRSKTWGEYNSNSQLQQFLGKWFSNKEI